MPVLPDVRDYAALYSQFRWDIPARYNIGVSCCDRWAAAEPNRLAILHVRGDGRQDAISYGWLRETSNRLANVLAAHGIARGDRVAIMLPQTPEVAAAHMAIYKLAAVALPIAVLFGPDALVLPAAEFRRAGADHQQAGRRQARRDPQRCARAHVRAVVRRRERWRRRLDRTARARLAGVHAGRDRARRSGGDDLYLGHHRPAQGRAACSSRAARPFARRGDAALPVPVSRRPLLDAGRLGLGRRPVRRAAAEPASRRAGGRPPHRQVRPGRRLRADARRSCAQRLHPADGAAHDARGEKPARALRFRAAQPGLRRRIARRRGAGLGPRGLRSRHQRILRPDRMQSGAVVLLGARRAQARRHRQAGARPQRGGDRPRRRSA